MSGELRTSQFRWTTTADDDFVIGNPSDSSTTPKYLVFQTTTTPGISTNPHLSLQWNNTSSAWNFHLNDLSGSGDINLSGAVNTTSNNTFYGINAFTEATTTSISFSPVTLATGGNTQFATTKFVTDEINYLLANPNGLAGTDGSGKIPLSILPSSIIGSLNYQGTWNAATNSPALVSGVGTKGQYFKVSVAGTTTLDGISNWNIGDDAVFDGAHWDKINGSATEVISVNTFTGAVSLTTANIPEAGSLYFLSPARLGDTVISFYTYPSSNLGPIANTDTVAAAFGKLQYQINAGVSEYNTLTTGLGGQSIASYVTAYTTAISSDYASAGELTAITSQVSTLTDSGAITSISSYVSSAITTAGTGYASASSFSTLNSQVQTLTGSGAITSIATYTSGAITAASVNYASASSFSTLNSNFNTLTGGTYTQISSQINNAFSTYTAQGIAIADAINALGTTIGNQNSSVVTSQTSTNGTSATYGLTLNTGLHGSMGMSLSAGNESSAIATVAIVPFTGQTNTIIVSGVPANSYAYGATHYAGPYTASVPTGHTSYLWAISGGTISGSTTGNSVTFNAGFGGTVTLACKIIDTTSDGHGGTISTVSNAVASMNVIAQPLSGSNTTYPVIDSAPANVAPSTTGLTASINSNSLISGHTYTYSWTITNGTITSGTTGSSITFNVGSSGPYCNVTCLLTDTTLSSTASTFTLDASQFNLVDPNTGTPYFSYDGTHHTLTFNGIVTISGSYVPVGGAAADVNANSTTINGGKIVITGANGIVGAINTANGGSNTTTIDGGSVTTNTLTANKLISDFSVTNTIRSTNYAVGTTSTAPVGFKLSGTAYPTTFLGDGSTTNVQFELGTNANFGGHQVATVVNKVFSPTISTGSISYSNSNGTFMSGQGIYITPSTSTRLLIFFPAAIVNSTGAGTATYQVMYGTGTKPAAGAASTGTAVPGLFGTQYFTFTISVNVLHEYYSGSSMAISGLTIGTQYWVDISMVCPTGGTSTTTGTLYVTEF